MKLTKYETQKIFAMYWGQYIIKVCRPEWDGKDLREVDSITMESDAFKDFILCLIPISEISDTDAIKVAELINDKKYTEGEIFKVVREGAKISVYSSEVKHIDTPSFGFRYETKLYTDGYAVKMGTSVPTYQMPYEAHQYLIQNGYNVPLFLGLDHWANGKTPIELGIAINNQPNTQVKPIK